jgi:hypothetical protein
MRKYCGRIWDAVQILISDLSLIIRVNFNFSILLLFLNGSCIRSTTTPVAGNAIQGNPTFTVTDKHFCLSLKLYVIINSVVQQDLLVWLQVFYINVPQTFSHDLAFSFGLNQTLAHAPRSLI